MTTLDRRIREDIEARIRSGEWRPGHRIPFETELAAHYACARATVSKALSALALAGLIERRRKAGSFVAMPRVNAAVLDIPDLAQLEGYRWQHLGSRQVGDCGLDLEGACGPFLAIDGLHHAAGRPLALEGRLIDLGAVPEAAAVDFAEESPGHWLLDHIPWTDAHHDIRAVAIDAGQGDLLDLPAGAACLQLERKTWRLGALVTHVRQIFAGDRYNLSAAFRSGS